MTLLFKHGYEKMNLRMLAKRVGIRVGSLYNYFECKEDLLFWLLEAGHERMSIQFEKIDEAVVDPEEGLRGFISFHLGHIVADPVEANILAMQPVHHLSRKNFRRYSDMQRAYTDKLCIIVERGVRAGKFRTSHPKLATFAIIQMLNNVPRWYRAGGELNPDQLIAFYTGLIFSMLGVPKSSTTRTSESRSQVSPLIKTRVHKVRISLKKSSG